MLYSNQKAQASIEAVIILPLLIVLLFTIILSSMTFFNLKADTVQTNYEFSRFVSLQGTCTTDAVNVAPTGKAHSLAYWLDKQYVSQGMTVTIYKETTLGKEDWGTPLVLTPDTVGPNNYDLKIYCPAILNKGSLIKSSVTSEVNISSPFYVFPRKYVSNYRVLAEFGEVG